MIAVQTALLAQYSVIAMQSRRTLFDQEKNAKTSRQEGCAQLRAPTLLEHQTSKATWTSSSE